MMLPSVIRHDIRANGLGNTNLRTLEVLEVSKENKADHLFMILSKKSKKFNSSL